MKKSMMMTLALIAIVSLLVVGGTLAWFTDEKSVTNVFKAGSVSIEINEEFTDVTDWVPGDTENKDVKFTSTGISDTFLRVSLTPVWYDSENAEQGNGYAIDNVTLNFAENYEQDWVFHNGWYYYNKILKTNDGTSWLLDSVTIAGEGTSNDYQGKVLKVIVKAEAVQAENDAYMDAWDLKSLPFTPIE